MIALVTDSNAQVPASLRDRYDVRVVPLTVVVDGSPYREGVDLGTDDFYARLRAGATVSTAAPSPGEVAVVYEDAVAAGATEILSVHVGSNTSGTVNAVSLAAAACSVPVEVVDTGTASFAVACCVWAAGEVVGAGGGLAAAAEAARGTAARVGNVFVVGALDLARRGGRLAPDVGDGDGIPVLALVEGEIRAVGAASDDVEALDVMVDQLRRATVTAGQRVGVGDGAAPELADDLAGRLRDLDGVLELVRYEIGPSVGAHTGPGTAGACFFPA